MRQFTVFPIYYFLIHTYTDTTAVYGNVIHLIRSTCTFHNTAAECPTSTRIFFSNPAKVLYSGESGGLLNLESSHRRGYLPRKSVLRFGKKSAGLHYTFNGRWLPSSNSIEDNSEIITYPFPPSPLYFSTLLLYQSPNHLHTQHTSRQDLRRSTLLKSQHTPASATKPHPISPTKRSQRAYSPTCQAKNPFQTFSPRRNWSCWKPTER